MMREVLRPFTKLVTLNDQDRVSIGLKDTGDDSITCNYVKVEAVSGSTGVDGLFFVSPTSVNSELNVLDYPEASGLLSMGASGSVGVAASIQTGSAVLSLNGNDASPAIFLSHTAAVPTSVVYAITYGVVTLSNTRKDNTLHPGD